MNKTPHVAKVQKKLIIYLNCPNCENPIENTDGSLMFEEGDLEKAFPHDWQNCPMCGSYIKRPANPWKKRGQSETTD